ncbi:hypothetical protein V1514DRAFT_325298 [Lipomyces japonicus]|uniref:uncharacterized protein n=1 Tax=Lipomyces japonicus TaxID=56871 RepID=UPI0034CEE95C
MSSTNTIFSVPPPRNPGPLPSEIKFDPYNRELTLSQYSDIFWITDKQLTRKDRKDITTQLSRVYVYKIFGALGGLLATATGSFFVMKRVFPATRRSMSVLFGLMGAQVGSGVGAVFGTERAHVDFKNRSQPDMIIHLIGYRPTLSLWLNYYSNGKPQGVWKTYWNSSKQDYQQQDRASWGDDKIDQLEREQFETQTDDFSSQFEASPQASPSWQIPVKQTGDNSNNLQQNRNTEFKKSVSNEPPRYKKSQQISTELETQEAFDKRVELERRGEDQPDDFSQSEKRYSKSKYD